MATDRAHRRGRSPVGRRAAAFHDRFVAAIDDDLDLPTALASCARPCAPTLPADERRWLVLDADRVLGLDLDRVWDADGGRDEAVPDDVRALVDERAARARAMRRRRLRAGRRAARRRSSAAGWEVEDAARRVDRPAPGLVAEPTSS